MKIVILDGYTENPGDLSWSGFEKYGELRVYDRTPFDDEEILKRIGDAEIIYTNKTPISRRVIEGAKALRFIGVLATGYNVVDIEAARDRDIPVSNIPGYGTAAVAQHTMALLLEACNNVGLHDRAVHDERWSEKEDFCFWEKPIIEICGKTMGIIGFGSIGRAVAQAASSIGMKILAYSPSILKKIESGEPYTVIDGVEYAELDEILKRSDVISLHCPLNEHNREMINRSTIGKMRDGAILINTARGQLINEADLYEALESGKIGWAALDVVSSEPVKKDNPLLKARNCIITPHIAWASVESRGRLMDMAVENLRCFLEGKPQNVVN